MSRAQNTKKNNPLVIVGCYTRFNNLAHKPRGTEANYGIYTFELDPKNGRLTLLSVLGEKDSKGCMNPAYFTYHPRKNIVYACTESIYENGVVAAYSLNPCTGKLSEIETQDAGGTSTCYLEFDHEEDPRHMLLVNYWNSTIGTLPMSKGGKIGPLKQILKSERPMVAKAQHDHLKQRQSEPHTHAVKLEPWTGQIAYVPDLGTDNIRQFCYNPSRGELVPRGLISAGDAAVRPHGPRYIIMGEKHHCVYLINELSSTVSVFAYDTNAAQKVIAGEHVPSLHLIQTISTIPPAFPRHLNTCGLITMHPTGRFVMVSNRGHDSITVYRVDETGMLGIVTYYHTGGQTPRHFNFDPSGQFIIIANQDTDTLVVLNFNQSSGEPSFLHSYPIPSPNFVLATEAHPQVERGADNSINVAATDTVYARL